MLSRDTPLSRAFECMRFPLLLFVVAFHFPLGLPRGHALYYLERVGESAQVLMSIFFFISGYLQYCGRDTYTPADYRRDLRSKTRSILLPFVVWSAIAYILFLLSPRAQLGLPEPGNFMRMFVHGFEAAPRRSILGYDFLERCSPSVTVPYWFLRDLFVLFLISPAFRWIALRLRVWTIPLLLIPFTLNAGLPNGLISLDGLYFYPLGVTFAVCGYDPAETARRLGPWLIVPWVVLTAMCAWMCGDFDNHHLFMGVRSQLFFRIYTLVSLPVWIRAFLWVQARPRLARPLMWLAPACFFIYVAHAPRAISVWMENFRILPGDSAQPGDIAVWVLAMTVLLGGLTLLYRLMSRHTPILLVPLAGGRLPKKQVISNK